MSMTRPEAVAHVARFARGLVDVTRARAIASGCGVRFDSLLIFEPALVRQNFRGGYVTAGGAGLDLVLVSELGASICLYMGIYADRDHAYASPHGTPGKQADYIGQRAAVHLARYWWGEPGVRDLRQAVPWLQRVLLQERPYKP